MDVLLINPPYNLKKSMGLLAQIVPTVMPIGLAYIAANLKKNGFSVEILDCQVHDFGFEILKKKILEGKPCMVGLTATTPMIHSALHVARMVKKISPETNVVLGGCHASFLSEEIVKKPCIDVVARGEAEVTAVFLARALKEKTPLSGVKGIAYKENGVVKVTEPREFVDNLDELPFPARELLPIGKYRPQLDMVIRSPVRVLMTARGCPFNCFFCGGRYITGKRYRYYSTGKVIEEIELLVNRYGARQLIFLDDNFVVNRKRTKEVCEAMIKKGLHKKLVWACESRVDGVTPEILKLMHDAGCRIVSYGIETSSQRLLNVLKKDITVDQIKNAVRWAKEAGLECRATFMLGIPTETRDDSLATIEFAKSLGLDRAKFSLATPYPGTEFYEMAKGQLGGRDWTEYNTMSGFTENDVIYVAEGRTAEELEEIQRRAMREFYLRPKVLFKLLSSIRSIQQVRDYLLSAKVLLSKK
jgi:radical SAM superfamily enzyme YgiQ (UPF0313 family)